MTAVLLVGACAVLPVILHVFLIFPERSPVLVYGSFESARFVRADARRVEVNDFQIRQVPQMSPYACGRNISLPIL